MENEIMSEFEKGFSSMQKRLGFKSSLEKIDSIFFVRDHIKKEGFVSDSLSRQVCARIIGSFNMWLDYFHTMLLPNPSNMVMVEESKMIQEQDKKRIVKIMSQIRSLSSKNMIIGLTKDEKLEGEFIDESVELWEKSLPFFIEIMKNVHAGWNKSALDEPSKPGKKEYAFF